MISLLCLMLNVPVTQAIPDEAVPTWHGEIEKIIVAHCAGCHQQAGSAPFPLTTYEEVSARSAFIEAVVQAGLMPPWLPSDHGLPLRGSRGLSDSQIELVSRWIQGGKPKGAVGLPVERPPVTSPREPDLRVSMQEAWRIPAEGGPNWGRRDRDKRSFVVPMNHNRTLKVSRLMHRSASPQAIHAMTMLADTTGGGRYLDNREEGPGYYMPGDIHDRPSGSLGGSGVGSRSLVLPDGYHWSLPADADLLMQVHFRPTGRAEHLQESVDFWVTDDPASRPLQTLISMVWRVDVPVAETRRLMESWTLPVAVDLVGMTPRANGVVTSLNLNATLPTGERLNLLDIPEYDPHWRMPYMLLEPLRLPAGTQVNSSWVLANTTENPRNPFVPLKPYITARRTGVVAMLLHVATLNQDDQQALMSWHDEMLRSRQRPRRSVKSGLEPSDTSR
ncbi:MAG: hypothetical protein CMJ39_12695 [Phycisphaerae bacterium]|nr:hypothetical protein [Phycisphaerae bacterium]